MRTIWKIIVYVCMLGFFVLALLTMTHRDATREKETLQQAIEQDITAYYAREGYYPSGVEELKELYGLTYDEERYYVAYELRGANIRPYIMIIDLEGE